MRISIITVTFNNLEGLESTFRSLDNNFDSEIFEWIVVDGNSTDGSKEFLFELSKHFPADRFMFISESDSGLYDAMNKGINLVKREDTFLHFLNAGDLIDPGLIDLFRELNNKNCIEKYDVLMGASRRFFGEKTYIKYPKSRDCIYKGMICEHQSILIRKKLFSGTFYDLTYCLSADYDLLSRILKKVPNGRILRSDVIFCSFEFGGVSKERRYEAILEDMLIRYRVHGLSLGRVIMLGILHGVWEGLKRYHGNIR